MFRKLIAAVMACAVLAVSFAFAEGCEHNYRKHADTEKHWMQCLNCGEIIEEGMHELDENDSCVICFGYVSNYGDGISVYVYDDFGNVTEMADYDMDGNRFFFTEYFYTYDENGNMLKMVEYYEGELSAEYDFAVVNGESIESNGIIYYSDGSSYVCEYDDYGNCTTATSYYPDGTVEYQEVYEYVQDSEGYWLLSSYRATFVDGSREEAFFDEYGNMIRSIRYDVDGTAWADNVYEYVILEEGYPIQKSITTTYGDGSVEVTEMDDYGNWISLVTYDANGEVVSTYTWEYTYHEDGYITAELYYENGRLSTESIYAVVDNGMYFYTYTETVTQYYEDGSKIVSVYDEDYNIISDTRYDEAGNVIE